MSQEIEPIFSLVRIIYGMAQNAKTSKRRCKELTKKVELMEKLVLRIQQLGQGRISPSLEYTLRSVRYNLQSTKEWIEKYTRNKGLKRYFGSGSHKEKSKKLNEDLSDSIQALSCALLVEFGEKIDSIYEAVTQRDVIRQRAPIPDFHGHTSGFNPGTHQFPLLPNIRLLYPIYNSSLVSTLFNFVMPSTNSNPRHPSTPFSNNGKEMYVFLSYLYWN